MGDDDRLFTALCLVFGIGVLPWLLVQAVVGFSLLEVVNYLEHDGLKWPRRDDGRYERNSTCARHSWNADHTVSTCCSTSSSATPTTTRTRSGATRRCATSRKPRSSRRATGR